MPNLYTIGYQGQTIEQFLDTLLAHGIEHVIDVRQLPFSRKADFSTHRALLIGFDDRIIIGLRPRGDLT